MTLSVQGKCIALYCRYTLTNLSRREVIERCRVLGGLDEIRPYPFQVEDSILNLP